MRCATKYSYTVCHFSAALGPTYRLREEEDDKNELHKNDGGKHDGILHHTSCIVLFIHAVSRIKTSYQHHVKKWSNNFDEMPHRRIVTLTPRLAAANGFVPPCWTPSNTWFLGPTRVSPPKGISISSAVFAQRTLPTNTHTHADTQTDRPRYSVRPSAAIAGILRNV